MLLSTGFFVLYNPCNRLHLCTVNAKEVKQERTKPAALTNNNDFS